jgi:hypothetical protein
MEALEIVTLLILAGAGWLVWSNLKAREAANTAIRSACDAGGLLFLNDTVGLDSIRPVRDDDGHVVLRRVYAFEYSDTGHDRRKGSVTLIGDRVTGLSVGPTSPDAATLH